MDYEDVQDKIVELIALITEKKSDDAFKLLNGGCLTIEQYRTLTGRLSAFNEVDIELKKLLK